MIIVAGGDSFIWGSELSDHCHGGAGGYSHKTFPALLAADHEYTCAAYPGNSNTQICNNVLLHLIRTMSLRTDQLVLVCWTWPTRDSIYDSVSMIQRLQDTLEAMDLSYLFTCADNCLLEWLDDRTNWHNWFLFPPGESWETPSPRGFYQWALENKYSVGPQQHPLEHAHQDAAQLMLEKFNEMVKKSI